MDSHTCALEGGGSERVGFGVGLAWLTARCTTTATARCAAACATSATTTAATTGVLHSNKQAIKYDAQRRKALWLRHTDGASAAAPPSAAAGAAAAGAAAPLAAAFFFSAWSSANERTLKPNSSFFFWLMSEGEQRAARGERSHAQPPKNPQSTNIVTSLCTEVFLCSVEIDRFFKLSFEVCS